MTTETRTYYRATDGRLVAGVCRGLAAHLGLDPLVVRLAFVVLAAAHGAGVLAYLAFWVVVPAAPRSSVEPAEPARDWPRLLAFGSLALGALLVLGLLGWAPGWGTLPIVVVGLGAAILWQRADEDRRERWRAVAGGQGRWAWARILLGAVLVVAGMAGFFAMRGQLSDARQGLLVTVLTVAGLAIIVAPWVLSMARDLSAERRERIRSQERAEFAAHIHDSVLHTLTLIQRHAEDEREVRRLARAQERELRTWLYRPKSDEDRSLSVAIERIVAEVEEAHGVPFEVVHVGDCSLDDRLVAALQAAREAMVNAAKYSGATPVSVYAEAEPELVTVFVRDRGKGFDLDAVPDDRLGVRESIIGRMRRNGGTASVRTSPGEGTEVTLEMPRRGGNET